VYRVCYLDRRSIDPSTKSYSERLKVNQSSLCVNRVGLMEQVIKAMLEGHPGVPSFALIEYAFDWIDKQGRSAELHTTHEVRKLYRDYTDHLRHRRRLSNVGDSTGSIGHATAQPRQGAMAYLCGLASETTPNVVQNWAIRIPQK